MKSKNQKRRENAAKLTAKQGSKSLEKLTMAYIALMLSVYLLFPGLDGYRAITEWKWRLLCLFSGGYVAAAAVLSAELAMIGTLRLPPPKDVWRRLSLAEKLLIAYWLASVVSALLSVDKRIAFWGGTRREGLVTITFCCGSCLLISRLGRPRQWMLYLAGAALCLNCVLCAVQFAGYNPFGLYPEGMNYYDANRLYAGEFLGTVGNVDILSAVLCLAVPAFAAAFVKLKGRARWFSLLFAAAGLAMLCLSRVAGGFVGLLGCAMVSVPALLRDKAAKRRAAVAVVLLCLVGLALVFAFGGRFGGTIREFSELLHGRWDDSFGSGRLYIWRSVLPLVPERPLFGGGPDTLSLRLDAAFERWDDNLGVLIRSSIDTAHNEYLGILTDQGLIALLCYLAMLAVLAVKWFRRGAKSPRCAVCGCAVLAYCIQAFFGIRSPISTPYFFIALAFLMKEDDETCDGREQD